MFNFEGEEVSCNFLAGSSPELFITGREVSMTAAPESARDKKRKHGEQMRKPSWLKVNLPSGERAQVVGRTKTQRHLFTVCEEAKCPNQQECWSSGTATFMLMGDVCTRGCRFCAVTSGKPEPLDSEEPQKLAEAVGLLGLHYVVLTSVDRDDLPDGGAAHLVRCVRSIKDIDPEILVEVLMPDFKGSRDSLELMVNSQAEVLAHNLETVERLTPKVRDPRASYKQSLEVLRLIKELDPGRYTKSSLMVGVGETHDELRHSFQDLREVGCDFLTIGQYLRPTRKHMPVERYVHPDMFETLRLEALEFGFAYVASGPLVRSSYKAGELYIENVVRSGKTSTDNRASDVFVQLL